MTTRTARNNAQIAERLSRLANTMSARLGMFMPTATHATPSAQSSGQKKTDSVKPQESASAQPAIEIGTSKRAAGLITSGVMVSLMKMSGRFSASRTSGVRFAQKACVKTALSSIIATLVATFAASCAIAATSVWPQSKGPASWTQHSHTSKGIEAVHKQLRDNTIDDKLEITPKELLNSAVFPWSRVVGMFSLNGTEMLYNRGEEEIIDLLAFYMESAEKSVKEEFEASLVSDGTGAGGRQLLGLGAAIPIIPNAGTYGGIDRATVANWRTSTFDVENGDIPGVTSWDSTTVRRVINHVVASRSRGSSYADLLICDLNSYQAIDAAFVAHQRLASERLGRLGFSGLTLITPAGPVDIVCATGIGAVMPENTIFGIDTKSMSLYTFPGQNFVPFHPGDGMRPINQDAIAQGIVWSGQLVLENPLYSFRIITENA